MRYIQRQSDGSFYISADVLDETLKFEPASRCVEIVQELTEVIRNGVSLPNVMVALQFAPTPYLLNQNPYLCKHTGPAVEHLWANGKKSGDAQCAHCGHILGWWCPKSPDHTCHYFTVGLNREGKYTVELRDGSLNMFDKHPLHHGDEEQSQTQESEDWCLFCGAPEERK